MKPAMCVLFLVMIMAQDQIGWAKSQKFFPNGRYGRHDPDLPALAGVEYENNMENSIDEQNENQLNNKEKSFNNKILNTLLNNNESKDKFKPNLKSSTDNFLLCLVSNRSQFGGDYPVKILCKTLKI